MTIGESFEVSTEWFIVISLLLIIISILCANVIDYFKITWFPESCIYLSVGIIFGSISLFWANQENTSAQILNKIQFNQNFFMYFLLPPIIFFGAFIFEKSLFFKNLLTIALLAGLGTIMTTIMIGLSYYGISYLITGYDTNGIIIMPQNLTLKESFAAASLISSTDPIAALAVYSQLGVEQTLYTLVFGESNLNDAVSIVLYNVFTTNLTNSTISIHSSESDSDNSINDEHIILAFVYTSIVGPLIGLFTAIVSSLVYKFGRLKNLPIFEVILFWSFSYMSFVLGEALDSSGIIASLFCGFGMKHYTFYNLSEKGKVHTLSVIEFLSILFDMMGFITLGISVITLDVPFFKAIPMIVIVIILCLVTRLISVFSIIYMINFRRKRSKRVDTISMKTAVALWYAGLRGAIAFVLALSFPTENAPIWIGSCLGVILFSVYFLGTTTSIMLKFLKIETNPDEESHISLSTRNKNMVMHSRFSLIDRKYLAPFLLEDSSRFEIFTSTFQNDKEKIDSDNNEDDNSEEELNQDKYHKDYEIIN
eukprot:TRINITY_DN10801_c0_g1_i1.p1 TRINITY_DN10801_c0_g1~~TRINITY_DN10801_c0_g1_i1.p1  ORF type:complete len:538 (+),score=59.53 TRINITY_DN10801_c0_g1_i1:196-1809(+)